MFKAFYPFAYVESVFSIDYKKLFNKGYRGIVFDIDNTLVPHGADSTKETDELFRNIQKIGLKTLLLSNNDEERIRRFIKNELTWDCPGKNVSINVSKYKRTITCSTVYFSLKLSSVVL